MYSDYTTYSVSVYTTIFCQIRGHGGIKHDDLTWNDPVVHIYM